MRRVYEWVRSHRTEVHYLAGFIAMMAGIGLALYLLGGSKIDGSNFVILTIAFLVLGLTIALLPSIAEITTGSFTVKMDKAKQEVEVTVQRLNESTIASLRPLIVMATKHPGGYSNSDEPIDSRVEDFFRLLDSVKKTGTYDLLRDEVIQTASTIASGQVYRISHFNEDAVFHELLNVVPPFEEVRTKALDHVGIEKTANRTGKSFDDLQNKILKALDSYRSLLDVVESKQS